MKISVLLVDDEPVLLDIGRMFLEKAGGFHIGEAISGIEALTKLKAEKYDAIVADYEMPGMDGLTLLREVRTRWPDLPYILFTGRGREEIVIEALNSGADFYLQKGGDPKAQFTELAHKIRQAVTTRRSSVELRESEETFRQFFEAAGEAIFILDHDHIADSNQRGISLLGRERDKILGHTLAEFSTPLQSDGLIAAESISQNINLALSGESPVFEWRVCRPGNTVIETEVSMNVLTIHGRSLLQAIVRDISLRKRDENIRMLNEIRLEAMIGLYALRDCNLKEITDFALESAITITGSRYGYLVFVSEDEQILTLYSRSGQTIKDGNISEKTISDEVKKNRLWEEAVRQRRAIISNDYAENSSGEKGEPQTGISLKSHMNIPVFDGDSIVIVAGVANKQDLYDKEDIRQLSLLMSGMWGIVRRKKTEEILQKKNYELAAAYEQLRTIEGELKKSEERYRGFVERSEDIIILLNNQFIPEYLSPAFSDITGYEEKQVLGKPLKMNILSPDDQAKIRRMMEEALSGKPISHFEIQIRKRDGKPVVLDMRAVPVHHLDKFIGIQIIGRDISEYKKIEKALVQANRRLTLLADLTRHDILNKLTTLNGFLDLVSDEGAHGKNTAHTVNQALDAVEGIKYLIEFTRDYQSLGIRETEWIDAGEALTLAVSQLMLGNIAIENQVSGITIRTDPLFSRALYNLFENSLRHGKTVTTIKVYPQYGEDTLSLIVEDDGAGVPDSEKTRIFEQGVGNNTGLGLFLVHEILTSTGLVIKETGQSGMGARFEITVPSGLFRITPTV